MIDLLDSYDLYGNKISVYLNAGELEVFDEDSSLIHCVDVYRCTVKNLRLTTGIYTLFIFDDHYFTTQKISYEVTFWSVQEEIIILVGVVVALIVSCSVIYCIYRAYCRSREPGKVSVIYDSKNRSFSPYTEISRDEIKANENLLPVTIELTTL